MPPLQKAGFDALQACGTVVRLLKPRGLRFPVMVLMILPRGPKHKDLVYDFSQCLGCASRYPQITVRSSHLRASPPNAPSLSGRLVPADRRWVSGASSVRPRDKCELCHQAVRVARQQDFLHGLARVSWSLPTILRVSMGAPRVPQFVRLA